MKLPRTWFVDKFESQGVDLPGAYYGHASSGYQRLRHGLLAQRVFETIGSQAGFMLLDVGTATGAQGYRIGRRLGVTRLVGTDFVTGAMKSGAALYPGMFFVSSGLPHLPFADACFDLLVASEVLYYFDEAGRRIALNEMRRVLRDNGVLVFTSTVGVEYFDVDRVRALFAGGFHEAASWADDFTCYRRLTYPLGLINAAYFVMKGGESLKCEGSRLYRTARLILRLSPVAWMLRVVRMCTDPVLASSLLPHLLMREVKNPGGNTGTNITFVFRKHATHSDG